MKTVLKMNQFPVGMELFSAGDSAQWDIIERTIRMTDYYVLILGHRYGTLGEDGLGYTEMEFNFAQELGIPIMGIPISLLTLSISIMALDEVSLRFFPT